MKDWTWPSAFVIAVLVAAIVIMFGLTNDPEMRKHLLGFLDSLVPFIAGAASGAGLGFARGKGII